MNIWTSLLMLILFVDALVLGLLILLQLPKKEAGLAAAFGAEQTAALFGAGSGSALTSITKWAAGIFLLLCLVISVLTAHITRTKDRGLGSQLDKLGISAPAVVPGATAALTNLAAPTLTPAPAPAVVPAPAPAK
jgi:protein translocase SecG subunit